MRLFLALEAPAAWRTEAARALEALAAALDAEARAALRPVAPERLHLTLRFFGEVSEADAPRLEAALRARLPPLRADLALAAAGTFGAPAHASAVWLGLGGGLGALREAARGAEAAALDAGLPPERRAWRPHLTIARVRPRASPDARRAIARAAAGLGAPAPRLRRFGAATLVRSRPGGRGGPRYEAIARFGEAGCASERARC